MWQVFKTTKKKPAQLEDLPELPEGLEYLFDYYNDVFTGEPLSYLELESWARMTGKYLVPWEVKAIKRLDRTFWQVQSGV